MLGRCRFKLWDDLKVKGLRAGGLQFRAPEMLKSEATLQGAAN